jgi:hydroxymethylbilane synthase
VSGPRPLRLGTRGSLLATTQSGWVARRIEAATGRRVELVTIRTKGDQIQDQPLSAIGGQGLFTREVDRALLDGEVDVAVHSLKDLPTVLIEGVTLAAVPEREDVRDVLIGPAQNPVTLESLPKGARLGTGSLRRRALALAFRPDLALLGIRGNLDTRVRLVDEGEYHAIILAAAGVRRLGWTQRIHEHLDPAGWLPAPGQGALAVVARTEDSETQTELRPLDHLPSRASVTAERSLMHHLEAGCQLPVGSLGIPFGGGMRLRGVVASPDGTRAVRAEATGAQDDPEALGRRVADRLLEMGAESILSEVDRTRDQSRSLSESRTDSQQVQA